MSLVSNKLRPDAHVRADVPSIPLHGVAETASLVVFQCVGKCRGVASEREVIRRIRGKHHRTAHVEAVQVALQ